MKRLIDLSIAAIGLFVLWPIILIAFLIIRYETPGPGLFKQTRVGRHKRPFTCYKLRTMYVDTAQRPTHDIGQSAITPFGRIARLTKMDELPQLINVIAADMSLVGPRPCLPSQTELIAARDSKGVFEVRPGITGLAQVQGITMVDPSRLAIVDEQYLKTSTLFGDLVLMLATVLGSNIGGRLARWQTTFPN